MPLKFHDAAFAKINDKILKDVGSYVLNKIPEVLGYNKKYIANSLLQYFFSLERSRIQNIVSSHKRSPGKGFSFDRRVVKLNRFIYYPEDGKISIKFSYLLKSILKFLIEWFKIFFLFFLSLVSLKSKNSEKVVLVYGVHPSNFIETDEEFINFCKNGPITILGDATSLIIQGDKIKKSSSPKYAKYESNPLYALLFKKRSISCNVTFISMHFNAFFMFFKMLYHSRLMSLLCTDIACHALAYVSNQQLLIENVLLTNSNASYQPLWMSNLKGRNYKLHMGWYSQNGEFPYILKWDPVHCHDVEFQHIIVDEHWVWTEYYANSLKKIGIPGLVHCVGPILWYLQPKTNHLKKVDNLINVSIFDITPHSKEKLKTMGINEGVHNYGSYENLHAFIMDIIDVSEKYGECKKIEVRLTLKHKRNHMDSHDQCYIKLVNLLSESGRIKILKPEANIFSIISKSDLVIVLPYSSPAIVADYLKVPVIFYDPSQEIVPEFDRSGKIRFSSGKEELRYDYKDLLE